MRVFFNNQIANLNNLIEKFAKYQKVLLVYSSLASNDQIEEIYESIKDSVVFNKVCSDLFNNELASDGYRMIIFLTSGMELCKFHFNTQDFINVYLPLNNEVLPFYYLMGDNDGYILFEENTIDINVYSFLYFHDVLECLTGFKGESGGVLSPIYKNNYTLEDSLEILNNSKISNFVDLKFLAEFDLGYSDLGCVQILLLDAFEQLISNINFGSLQMIDVFKYHNEDMDMIDRLYKIFSNENYFKLLRLNSNQILNKIVEAKQKIMFLIQNTNQNNDFDLDEIIKKLKIFCSKHDELSELYLYNIIC